MPNTSINSTDTICFPRNDFNLYLFLMFCIVIFLVFVVKKSKEELTIPQLEKTNSLLLQKINELQRILNNCESKQTQKVGNTSEQIRQSSLNRIYNPLVPPERSYPLGRFNQSSNDEYQQIGFIFNNNERYPLYGRPKYPGRTDKYEYYIIDETRNRLKIPYRSKNDNELYDGDTIHIDPLQNDFSVKIYDYDQYRYNPNIL
jgi:hypothetical protein